MSKTKEIIEHGPENVCYSNGPYGLMPFLQCMCGWSVSTPIWEDIGVEFDEHLEAKK